MKIDAINAVFPSRRITNEVLLSEIRNINRDLALSEVDTYCNRLDAILRKTGSKIRFIRDRAKGETALSLIAKVTNRTLEDAKLTADKVDCLIYCGVGRGFLEPATAYVVANEIGASCECFDILDACMGWTRALEVAYAFLSSGRFANILVVNGEFNIYESGYPEILKIGNADNLRYTFPAFTIGEAATATVVTSSSDAWIFRFRSTPSLARLCTIPTKGYSDYCRNGEYSALNGIDQFLSFGSELSNAALSELLTFIRETYPDLGTIDLWLPHAASGFMCDIAGRELGLGDRLYSSVFAEYGNVVSASVPVGIWKALNEDRLRRGSRVVLCPASAGMSVALVEFTF